MVIVTDYTPGGQLFFVLPFMAHKKPPYRTVIVR